MPRSCRWTRILAAALLGAACLIPLRTQAAADKAKLRQAAAFPTLRLSPAISFTTQAGYRSSSDLRDLPAEIAVIQKALTGKDADAGRYLQMGKLYQEGNDPARAKAAFSRSVVLYRHQAAKRSKDAIVLAAFGTALAAAKQMAEAETVLRQAVRIAPRQVSAWTALGDFLTGQAIAALLPPSFETDGVDFGFAFGAAVVGMPEKQTAFLAKYGQVKPTAAQSARSLALLDESRACYDQAVTSQPTSATAFLERAGFRMSISPVLRGMLTALQPEGTVDIATALKNANLSSAREMASPASSSPGLSDLAEAARLAPNSLTDVGMSAMFHTLSFVVQYAQTHDTKDGLPWDTLTEETRRPVQEAIRPLEHLAESAATSKDTAAKASEAAGLIWLLLGNWKAAEPPLRRAIMIDPRRADAWDAITLIMLQRSDTPAVLTEARTQLFKIGDLYRKAPTPDNWTSYTLLLSIYSALTGSELQARQHLNEILKGDNANEGAKQALAALGPEIPN